MLGGLGPQRRRAPVCCKGLLGFLLFGQDFWGWFGGFWASCGWFWVGFSLVFGIFCWLYQTFQTALKDFGEKPRNTPSKSPENTNPLLSRLASFTWLLWLQGKAQIHWLGDFWHPEEVHELSLSTCWGAALQEKMPAQVSDNRGQGVDVQPIFASSIQNLEIDISMHSPSQRPFLILFAISLLSPSSWSPQQPATNLATSSPSAACLGETAPSMGPLLPYFFLLPAEDAENISLLEMLQ